MLDAKTTYWFPMRVTYGREQIVKEFLDTIDVETFLPMTERVRRVNNKIVHEKVPAISNLIFVHSDKKTIDSLKHTRPGGAPPLYDPSC